MIPLHEYAKLPEALRVPKGSILAASPGQIEPEWLARWSLKELDALARVLAVPTSGTRAELIDRIVLYNDLRRELASETHETLRQRPGKELKEMLRSVKTYAGGNKYGMASALIGWREGCRLKGRAALAEANYARHVGRAVQRGEDVPVELRDRYVGRRRDIIPGLDT